jgi:hypothetical protein
MMKKSLVSMFMSLSIGLIAFVDDTAYSAELQKQTFSCLSDQDATVIVTMLLEVEPSIVNGFAKIEISEFGKPAKHILGIVQRGMWTVDRFTIHSIDEMTGNYRLNLISDDYFAMKQGQSFSAQLAIEGYSSLSCTVGG